MKTSIRTLLSTAVLCLYGLVFVGCSNQPGDVASSPTSAADHDDHDHHDHDHDDHDHDDHDHDDHDHDEHDHDESHAGHDHPAHGPNGGHMVELSGGAHAEWAHDDETDLITVYAEEPDDVTKVEMKTTIEGNETVYAFEQKEVDGQTTFQLVSPELLTAIKMGKLVNTTLVITTTQGETSGQVQHHAH